MDKTPLELIAYINMLADTAEQIGQYTLGMNIRSLANNFAERQQNIIAAEENGLRNAMQIFLAHVPSMPYSEERKAVELVFEKIKALQPKEVHNG